MLKNPTVIVLIGLGLIVLVFSLALDLLGLGVDPAIGWKQSLGAVIGLFIILAGLWLARRKPG